MYPQEQKNVYFKKSILVENFFVSQSMTSQHIFRKAQEISKNSDIIIPKHVSWF